MFCNCAAFVVKSHGADDVRSPLAKMTAIGAHVRWRAPAARADLLAQRRDGWRYVGIARPIGSAAPVLWLQTCTWRTC